MGDNLMGDPMPPDHLAAHVQHPRHVDLGSDNPQDLGRFARAQRGREVDRLGATGVAQGGDPEFLAVATGLEVCVQPEEPYAVGRT